MSLPEAIRILDEARRKRWHRNGPDWRRVDAALRAAERDFGVLLDTERAPLYHLGGHPENKQPDYERLRRLVLRVLATMADCVAWMNRTPAEQTGAAERGDRLELFWTLRRHLGALAGMPLPTPDEADEAGAAELGSRELRKWRWVAEALLLRKEHPEWPDAEIARQVGVHAGTLSRNKTYRAARAMVHSGKGNPRRGYVIRNDDTKHSDIVPTTDDQDSTG